MAIGKKKSTVDAVNQRVDRKKTKETIYILVLFVDLFDVFDYMSWGEFLSFQKGSKYRPISTICHTSILL